LHQKAELTIARFARRFGFALDKISANFRLATKSAKTKTQVDTAIVTGNQSLSTVCNTDERAIRIMKAADSWTTYRTRFLVKAKQLATSFTFTDALGRQHSGRRGDYLVEFSDGVLRIASRQIFEDIYVPIAADGHNMVQPQPSFPAFGKGTTSVVPIAPVIENAALAAEDNAATVGANSYPRQA
jgi:hypothetical protein